MNKTNKFLLSDEDKVMLFDQVEKAGLLNKELLVWHQNISDIRFGLINVSNESSIREANRKITAKIMLLVSGQLSGQIIKALSVGNLLLGAIGLRSLLEYLINTKYIFAHPKHLDDLNWMQDKCDDLFCRTQNPKAMKHQLGDTIPKDRAYEVDLKELYDSTYADLCNYTHLMNYALDMNNQVVFKKNTLMIPPSCLSYAHDIGEYICECFKFDKNIELQRKLIAFQDECFKYAE